MIVLKDNWQNIVTQMQSIIAEATILVEKLSLVNNSNDYKDVKQEIKKWYLSTKEFVNNSFHEIHWFCSYHNPILAFDDNFNHSDKEKLVRNLKEVIETLKIQKYTIQLSDAVKYPKHPALKAREEWSTENIHEFLLYKLYQFNILDKDLYCPLWGVIEGGLFDFSQDELHKVVLLFEMAGYIEKPYSGYVSINTTFPKIKVWCKINRKGNNFIKNKLLDLQIKFDIQK